MSKNLIAKLKALAKAGQINIYRASDPEVPEVDSASTIERVGKDGYYVQIFSEHGRAPSSFIFTKQDFEDDKLNDGLVEGIQKYLHFFHREADSAAEMNFSGGPSVLPLEVRQSVSKAILHLDDAEASILSAHHRSQWFSNLVSATKELLHFKFGVSRDYEILFLQGGATQQFFATALNVAKFKSKSHAAGGYIETGYWSSKAREESTPWCSTSVLWSGDSIPEQKDLVTKTPIDFLHYVSNETVNGIQFSYTPRLDGVLTVCDASSDFLTCPHSTADIIYAHAQKNLGTAGVTIVLVKKELFNTYPLNFPASLSYEVQAKHNSMYNTPPVVAIFTLYEMLNWLASNTGSLEGLISLTNKKSRVIREAIQKSAKFELISKANHSNVNVVFKGPSQTFEEGFLAFLRRQNVIGLEGHRAVGGLRASTYLGLSLDAAEKLAGYIEEYDQYVK